MRWLPLALALATLTALSAGCVSGDSPRVLTEAEAREATTQALEDFATNFGALDGGGLKMVEGQFGVGNDGSDQATFVFEWGRGDTARVSLSASGSLAGAVEIYCSADRVVIVVEGQAVESRPQPQVSCLNSFQDTGDPLEQFQVEDADELNVTPNPDGTVTASYQTEEAELIMSIDAQQRLTRMDFITPQASGFLDMSYGARRTITLPQADERMPAMITGQGYHDGQAYQWSGFGSDEAHPFEEFEVRVIDTQSGGTVVTFPMGEGRTIEGFTFTYNDDGDGLFGGGDTFTISRDGWNSESQFQVVVWDTWADRALGDYPIPGPGILVFVALLGAAMLLRRR